MTFKTLLAIKLRDLLDDVLELLLPFSFLGENLRFGVGLKSSARL